MKPLWGAWQSVNTFPREHVSSSACCILHSDLAAWWWYWFWKELCGSWPSVCERVCDRFCALKECSRSVCDKSLFFSCVLVSVNLMWFDLHKPLRPLPSLFSLLPLRRLWYWKSCGGFHCLFNCLFVIRLYRASYPSLLPPCAEGHHTDTTMTSCWWVNFTNPPKSNVSPLRQFK